MIIDSDNYAAAGIETLFFPGGEPHAKIPPALGGDVLLFLKLRTWNDTGIAACVIDALSRNNNVGILDVFIPYFPGARQDRSDGFASLTVILMANLLSNSTRAKYHLFDPHSPITDNVVWSSSIQMPADLDVPISEGVVGIIAPDEGAVSRAESFRNTFYLGAGFVQCVKHRDSRTGRILDYHVPELPSTGTYIIVDDICDGGGTFNLLATAFKSTRRGQFSRLEMFVSHGIFSKGLVNIDPRIEKITTTDSWCRDSYSFGFDEPQRNRLEIIKLAPLFQKITGREIP